MTAVVDVVVPVLRRPLRARPFMTSLRATAGDRASVLAVYSSWDQSTGRAWRRAGADVLEFGAQPGSFAQKVNAGFRARATSEFLAGDPPPWVLLVGDDVVFRPGWLDAALAAATDGVHVVGTNDLGPAGADGAAHPMVRRSYVDLLGATWTDGPGVVCHEGYRHNYVDTELAHAAKDGGVFAPAHDAVIEHLHHTFGKGAVDPVYELGAASLADDRELYLARAEAHGGRRAG